MEKLIDSHSHLNDSCFDNEIEKIIKNMKEMNVDKVLVPAWDINSSLKTVELIKNNDELYGAVGIHPENIDGLKIEDISKIKDLAMNKKIIAIGEIGLDYHYTSENKELQKNFLIKQLDLSYEMNLPVLIHMRDATEDFMILIKDYIKRKGMRDNIGIMHSFSGSVETMNELIKLGFYISFSGPVTFKNARVQKECAMACRNDRILIETDAPYLTPHPYRGLRNEPKNVYYVLEEISKLKNISIDELSKDIRENFKKLFNLEEL